VTFLLDGGTYGGSNQALLVQSVPHGQDATALSAVPTRNGYTFTGWSPVLNLINVTENREFVAQWIRNHTVTFDLNGGEYDGDQDLLIQTVPHEQDATALSENPTRPGFTFNGWTSVLNLLNVTENRTFVARWTPIDTTALTVTYDVTGTRPATYSGMPASPQTAAAGDTVTVAPTPTTTETTHNGVTGTWTFNGWNHATITGPTFTMPNAHVTLTGFWTFTPATGGNGGIPGGGIPGGGTPGSGTPGGGTPGQPGNGGGPGPFSPYHNSFIIGRPSGNIYPRDNMTRAEVTTVFFRLLSDDFRAQMWNQQNPFSDVNGTDWFNNAVSTMANAGVVQGRPDGTFQPNHPITRAEVAAITARFFNETSQNPGAFIDTAGHWAEGYIDLLADFGWVQGSGDGIFRPNDPVTRAEVAAIVNRMLNRVPESIDSLLDGRTLWPDKTNQGAWYYLYLQEASHSTEFERLSNSYLNWTELLSHIEWQLLELPDSRPGDVRTSRR